MRLIYSPAAATAIRLLPRKDAAALAAKLQTVVTEPFGRHPWATALQGGHGRFRVRQGDWRAVYRVHTDTQAVVVELIGNRREVYR